MRHLLLPKHDIYLGAALSGLGLALYMKGQFAKAEQYTREAIDAFTRHDRHDGGGGGDGVDVAVAKGTLALIVSQTGDPKETEKLYRQALALRPRDAGAGTRSTMMRSYKVTVSTAGAARPTGSIRVAR